MTKPTILPGFYRWPSGRTYAHTELRVFKYQGAWHVLPKGVKR